MKECTHYCVQCCRNTNTVKCLRFFVGKIAQSWPLHSATICAGGIHAVFIQYLDNDVMISTSLSKRGKQRGRGERDTERNREREYRICSVFLLKKHVKGNFLRRQTLLHSLFSACSTPCTAFEYVAFHTLARLYPVNFFYPSLLLQFSPISPFHLYCFNHFKWMGRGGGR